MGRKLVKQGKDTLTVSLPKSWCDKNKLDSGDEIDFEELKSGLLIKNKTITEDKLEVNLEGLNYLTKRYIRSVGRLGFDTIVIYNKDPDVIKEIQESLEKDLFGYDIILQDEFKTVIKNMSFMKSDQFYESLRRNFDVTKSMIEGLKESIVKADTTKIESVLYLEKTNNKIMSFCKSILFNDTKFSKKESIILYGILEYLEKICDELRYLGVFIKENSTEIKKINKEIPKAFDKLCELFTLFYGYFLDNDTRLIESYPKYRLINYELINKIPVKTNVETAIVHYLMTMLNHIGSGFYQALKLKIVLGQDKHVIEKF